MAVLVIGAALTGVFVVGEPLLSVEVKIAGLIAVALFNVRLGTNCAEKSKLCCAPAQTRPPGAGAVIFEQVPPRKKKVSVAPAGVGRLAIGGQVARSGFVPRQIFSNRPPGAGNDVACKFGGRVSVIR